MSSASAAAKRKPDDITDRKGGAGASAHAATGDVGGVSGVRLKSFIERIERLELERKALSDDLKDVYGEAKAMGFEPKIIRKMVRLRKMDLEKRREEEELLDLYMAAVGMAE